MSPNRKVIGQWVQLAGAAAIVGGAIASLHHVAIAALILGGGAAFYVGHKLRNS